MRDDEGNFSGDEPADPSPPNKFAAELEALAKEHGETHTLWATASLLIIP